MPFVIFSMAGGWLADHFSKRQVTTWTRVMEIGTMTIATAGLPKELSGVTEQVFAVTALPDNKKANASSSSRRFQLKSSLQ
jgi:nitrate/nitrite transporter NarK